MLKYTVNNKNLKLHYEEIINYAAAQTDGVSAVFTSDVVPFLTTDDFISFYREDGDDILYFDEKEVLGVSAGTQFKFELPQFADRRLTPESIEEETIGLYNGREVDFIVLKFNEPHYANANRDGIFVEKYLSAATQETLCSGDTFLFNNYFLYRVNADESVTLLNSNCQLFWIDVFGTKHVTMCTVPCTYGGKDMEQTLLLPNNQYTQLLLNNYESTTYYVKDLRFFDYTNIEAYEKWALTPKPGTIIRIERGNPVFSIPVIQDFDPSLLKFDGISQYLEEDAESKITAPVDYEKQQFVPIIKTDVGYSDLALITINAQVRLRDENWDVIPESGWSLTYDGGTYAGHIRKNGSTVDMMGFNGKDIYYQKKKVSETFLRLSFYDTVNRGSQKLLYTAKIFLDANALWKTCADYFAQNSGTSIDTFDPVSGSPSSAEKFQVTFSCTDKYDYDKSTEGFYLHLFPGDLKELGGDGAIIYMKAELCNAKYGTVVPLVLPQGIPLVDYQGIKTIRRTDIENFSYTLINNGTVSSDMEGYYRDTYVKIRIRYNESKSRYEWQLDLNNDGTKEGAFWMIEGNSLIMTFLEPRMIKY